MVIGEFQKNTSEIVRVSFEIYKGRNFLDVRAYFETDNGEWRPTKKGIAIAPDKIDNLIELLQSAKKKALR
ncbi:MAG: transcriptional coactivator p15/PC4 family protein [Thermodesulfovibrionales bacterium]|jgi:hypothetical protein